MSKAQLSAPRTHLSGENLLQIPSETIEAGLLEEDQVRDQDNINHIFPTGHRLMVNIDGQSIQIEDIHGQLQVEIDITNQGPQIRLNGGELNLTSPENVSLDCNAFRISTRENTEIIAKGHVKIDSREEMKITCQDDVYVRGKVIWLN